MSNIISKSSFLKGYQCLKLLYLYIFKPELIPPIDDTLKRRFEQGSEIGVLAQQLFPNGVSVSSVNDRNINHSVELTSQLIDNKTDVIYEASFLYSDLFCAIDILTSDNDGYKIYEVKSSTSVTDIYIYDVAFQYYILNKLGMHVLDASVVILNNQYVRGDILDITKLFSIESVYKEILLLQDEIESNIGQIRKIFEIQKLPDIDIGQHCNSTYECVFQSHCWKNIPDYSIFNISRLDWKKKMKLYQKGIVKIEDIDDNTIKEMKFSEKQLIQIKGKRRIKKEPIIDFINALQYPIYFMDFETIQYALPIYINTKPYQQIPFQYSIHRLNSPNGDIDHYEFIGDGKNDPRLDFIKHLVDNLSSNGDILVYNKSFEISRIKELINYNPIYSNKLTDIVSRIKDLMQIFMEQNLYYPEMKGSYSIKYVLPALVPDLNYSTLEIQNGGMAMDAYANLMNETDSDKINKIQNELLEYCKMDTYAMVKILEKINQLKFA